jgi:hypothetical protein
VAWHIVVSPASTPGRFEARLDGELLCAARTPLLSAARVLLDRGASPTDTITMRHAGSHTVAMRSTVGVAAKLTVDETSGNGTPRFRPYDAPQMSNQPPPAAVSGSEAIDIPADDNAHPEASRLQVAA